MSIIGFLHTSPVHVPTFELLATELGPEIGVRSVVDQELLAIARAERPDSAGTRRGVASAINELSRAGCGVIVCTCSTIGGVSEVIGRELGAIVLRVDRPMAELAVDSGDRIAVVAALESTLDPTRELLESVGREMSRTVSIKTYLVDDAWLLFEAGDTAGYIGLIARSLPRIASDADVIVLAQASMATAANEVDITVPVLSSPRSAVAAAIQLLVTKRPD